MKVLQINHSYKNGGSTGRIVYDLMQLSYSEGIEPHVAYGYSFAELTEQNIYQICSIPELQFSKLQTRVFGRHGFYNVGETKRLLKYIDSLAPDVIHLHNLHNHYINTELLFEYIKGKDIPVIWTLHDCWAFTGWCAYFDYVQCKKWETECNNCPSLQDYPYTWFFDKSRSNYNMKMETFNGVADLTIVTPSIWLSNLVKRSYLKDYKTLVINNGVDTNVFRPNVSDVKEKLGIQGKMMVLAVASEFNKRKGLEFLLQLPQKLNENQVLVLVGIKAEQRAILPKHKCIGIERTESIEELANYYSAADVFINPTLEDNFPTTNLESLACGTPVVTFDTGGSVESVDISTGRIVEKGDLEGLNSAIQQILCNPSILDKQDCLNRARTKFEKDAQYLKYIDLYRTVVNRR